MQKSSVSVRRVQFIVLSSIQLSLGRRHKMNKHMRQTSLQIQRVAPQKQRNDPPSKAMNKIHSYAHSFIWRLWVLLSSAVYIPYLHSLYTLLLKRMNESEENTMILPHAHAPAHMHACTQAQTQQVCTCGHEHACLRVCVCVRTHVHAVRACMQAHTHICTLRDHNWIIVFNKTTAGV